MWESRFWRGGYLSRLGCERSLLFKLAVQELISEPNVHFGKLYKILQRNPVTHSRLIAFLL
jgi:hypothetical protein